MSFCKALTPAHAGLFCYRIMRGSRVRVFGAWATPTGLSRMGGLKGCLLDINALIPFIECRL